MKEKQHANWKENLKWFFPQKNKRRSTDVPGKKQDWRTDGITKIAKIRAVVFTSTDAKDAL